MVVIFIGLPFFKSISDGWLTSYSPKFTEEQVRMADDAVRTLEICIPVSDYVDPLTHSEVCKSLRLGDFASATHNVEMASSQLNLEKAACVEALTIGLWLLNCCSPQSISLATLNLLACDYYFPII